MNVPRQPFTVVSLSSSTNWTLHGLRSSTVIGFAQRTLPLIVISRFTLYNCNPIVMHVGGEEKNAYDVNQVYQSEIKAQQTFVTVKLMSWLVKFIVKRLFTRENHPGEPRKKRSCQKMFHAIDVENLFTQSIYNKRACRVGFTTIVNITWDIPRW